MTPPIAGDPLQPAVTRSGDYSGFPERFNRYYTDRAWQPSRTIYVSRDGSGDGASRDAPAAAASGLSMVDPGTRVVFLAGTYDGCYELSDREGTYDAPIVLFAERNPDGTRGVHVNCCASGRQTCINLEGADYVAVDGFELQGGRYGVRAVGLDYPASEHQRGVAVLNVHAYGQSNDPMFTGQSDWAVFERNIGHDAGSGDGHGLYISNGSDWNIIRGNELYNNYSSDFQINADPLSTCDDFDSEACDGVAGSGEGGQGASDFMLVELNFFHHGLAQGPNFTSVRRSVVRNNVIALYERHGTSFWQETENPRLGSSDNQIHHNLFVGRNSQHVLQFINGSTRNDVRNNLFVGVTVSGATVTANDSTVLMEVDASAADNTYAGNFYVGGRLEGRSPAAEETARPDLDPAWFTRFPVAYPATLDDFRPAAAAPWLDLGALLETVTVDIEGTPRSAPVDVGPFELP